ncbi:ribosomal RNA large subunit methyltransferase H [Companilactobacillus sp. RD055328]|uniref:23S rRNA (pseudouridine(1915)-N(3))-methyltransferase RlmH n=1 Tax=Companilactobacillus sp. RD055328 TaxID=2916634 RepID=UPI001FC84533|nr:23S rRNA (pseudouridine(1915)-N(3))-methyltransferase RlmH [Companilactobacillus sp. RD055328]GKQ43329.1 ribosomal RNA large subunit methyltransferase H [Companilactobacillus sp. RD055328]
MNIKIIGVGKLKEKYLKQGIAEYAKRLSAFGKFEIIEVSDEKAPESLSTTEMEKIKQTEGQRILEKIKDKEYVFLLAIKGEQLSSEELSERISNLTTYGKSDITFVIGGSLGTSQELSKRADAEISFGRFTLPHQLMRLVLAEQIYRAFMIDAGRTYHK